MYNGFISGAVAAISVPQIQLIKIQMSQAQDILGIVMTHSYNSSTLVIWSAVTVFS